MRFTRFALVRALAGPAVALLVAGCGLNTSSSPEPLAEDAVPPQLGGEQAAEEADAGDGEAADQRPFTFWLVGGNDDRELVPVTFPITQDPSATMVLENLLDFPYEVLSEEGHTNAIPSGTTVLAVVEDDGDLRVDLSAAFYEDVEVGSGRFAYGQVVLTLVGLPGVEGIQFFREGEPVTARDGEGAEVDAGEAVTEDDYADITRP